MAAFTLDDIRAAAEAKYGSTDIQVGDTRPAAQPAAPARRSARAELMAVQKQLDARTRDAAEIDQEELLADAIRLVAETKAQAATLLDRSRR